MATIINAVSGTGLTQSADASGQIKIQSNGVTTNALAWANYNGSTSSGIRATYNISSITRSAQGAYSVAFTNQTSDANYSVLISYSPDQSGSFGGGAFSPALFTTNRTSFNALPSTSGFGFSANWNSANYADPTYIAIAVFGN